MSERSADVDRFWLDTMEDTISIVRAVLLITRFSSCSAAQCLLSSKTC